MASSESSQERTEPFSQGELDARFRTVSEEQHVPADDSDAVPLDVLRVEDHHHLQGVRILVRPLTNLPNARSVSPGSDSCRWLALRAEVASSDQPEHKVLAVTQTSKDIKFSVRIPGEFQDRSPRPPLWCELYYDPASDKVVFLNRSDVPISLSRVSQKPSSGPVGDAHSINPGLAKALRPGTWRITVRDIAVLDFRILEKPPITLYQPPSATAHEGKPASALATKDALPSSSSDEINKSGKRPRSPPQEMVKRSRVRLSEPDKPSQPIQSNNDGLIMVLGPTADPLVFSLPKSRESKELSSANGHPLLDAEPGDTVAVPGVCEVDEYQITRREPIASTSLSAVYTANHSRVSDNIVTVKVLKTRVINPNEKPLVHERNVIRQADMWLRECKSQEDLQHESIVKYYGGDARFLSLYMEHVDAQDLTAAPRWRSKITEEFQGDRADAVRIMRDIASALDYIHGRKLVHNDIKPANILYSPDRGAVLLRFRAIHTGKQLSDQRRDTRTTFPEFIGRKLRGPPSDVWALGITMLYVLRKITFPDGRARRQHPRPLYWQIAGVNNPTAPHKQFGNGQPAINQMRDWLTEIYDAREKLDVSDRLERLTREMLYPNPALRITMAAVVQELAAELPVAAG